MTIDNSSLETAVAALSVQLMELSMVVAYLSKIMQDQLGLKVDPEDFRKFMESALGELEKLK